MRLTCSCCGSITEVSQILSGWDSYRCSRCLSASRQRASGAHKRANTLNEKTDEISHIPFRGQEEKWFEFARFVGVDPVQIEQLVEVVSDGRWRVSKSLRKYLVTATGRRYARIAAHIGHLPKADLFSPYWDAGDGRTRVIRDPGHPERPFCSFGRCETRGDVSFNGEGFKMSAPDEMRILESIIAKTDEPQNVRPSYVPGTRDERTAHLRSLQNREAALTRLNAGDWRALRSGPLAAWDDDELEILWRRLYDDSSLTEYLKSFPKSEQKRYMAADRRVRRKLPKLRTQLLDTYRKRLRSQNDYRTM